MHPLQLKKDMEKAYMLCVPCLISFSGRGRRLNSVLDLGFDQGGGIPHQAEKGGGIWQLGGGVF